MFPWLGGRPAVGAPPAEVRELYLGVELLGVLFAQAHALFTPASAVATAVNPLGPLGDHEDFALLSIVQWAHLDDRPTSGLDRLHFLVRADEVDVARHPRSPVAPAAFADRPLEKRLVAFCHRGKHRAVAPALVGRMSRVVQQDRESIIVASGRHNAPVQTATIPTKAGNGCSDREVSWQSQLADSFGVNRDLRTGAGELALASGLERLLEVSRLLEEEYGTPDLGNKDDPVDELVYIILSRRTRESAYQSGFLALRERFATWEEVVTASIEAVESVIRPTGLAQKKARSIKQALATLVERFGGCTLEPTRAWADDEVKDFLCSLPEIGPKSAACVMMWSLGRPAFPVDTHVGRVLERVGVWSEVGLSLGGADHKAKQAILADLVPPSIRIPLHVNALVHGRSTCRPARPRCSFCGIASLCDLAADEVARQSG